MAGKPRDSEPPRLGSVGTFVAGREVVAFFALTLVLSWALWVPGVVGLGNFDALVTGIVVVGGFGPLVAAAIVTWLVGDSLRDWAGQVLRWRVNVQWYLAAVGIPLVLFAVAAGVYVVLGNPLGESELHQQIPMFAVPVIHVVSMVPVLFAGGGQEELGWRGFALPRLLDDVNAVVASLVIGAVWAVWHLPLFMLEGSSQFGGDFVAYSVGLLALSILFTWLYRGTGGSVLLAMILHAGYNASSGSVAALFPIENVNSLSWILAAVMWMLALGLIAMYGAELRSDPPDTRETVEGRAPPDV